MSARFLRPCQAALDAHDQDSTIVSKMMPYRKTMTHFDRRCGSLLSQFDSLVHCLVSTDCHIIYIGLVVGLNIDMIIGPTCTDH